MSSPEPGGAKVPRLRLEVEALHGKGSAEGSITGPFLKKKSWLEDWTRDEAARACRPDFNPFAEPQALEGIADASTSYDALIAPNHGLGAAPCSQLEVFRSAVMQKQTGRASSLLGAALDPHSMAIHVSMHMQVRHVQGAGVGTLWGGCNDVWSQSVLLYPRPGLRLFHACRAQSLWCRIRIGREK